MTDPELVSKKLAQIETFVAQLRELADPARIEVDIREARFVEHTLQIAIQAALDVASHIVSDARLGEPESSRDLFRLIEGRGWISSELSSTLQAMTGFRNLLVHGYAEVDLRIVRDVIESRLDDLLDFVSAIRRLLD
jgi:uncharacterized protein YutE (UPF0331/DUF86 family)